jgi:hypothetical protein
LPAVLVVPPAPERAAASLVPPASGKPSSRGCGPQPAKMTAAVHAPKMIGFERMREV